MWEDNVLVGPNHFPTALILLNGILTAYVFLNPCAGQQLFLVKVLGSFFPADG